MEGRTSSTDESDDRRDVAPRSDSWMFPALLLLVLVGVAIFAFTQRPPGGDSDSVAEAETWTPAAAPTGETVQLVIDFGNGARREFDSLPWRPEMTVADVLEAARTFRPGIRFTQQGAGESGFLTTLEGVGGEGAEGRNWRFSVDGKLGEESFCLVTVEAGGSVLWEYTEKY